MNFYIIANVANAGLGSEGMSGGDRIAQAFITKWASEGCKISIFTGVSGKKIYKFKVDGIGNIDFIITSFFLNKDFSYFRLLFFEILSLFNGCKKALKINCLSEEKTVIYSASDFWPDSVPAFIMKLRRPKFIWIAGFYMFAPKPWQKDSPYKGKRWLVGLIYYLTQLPTYWMINKYADIIFVTSEPDVKKFVTKKRGRDKIVIVRGGVDIQPTADYWTRGEIIAVENRKYDAVFIGRFHYQKGVKELINIWRLVCGKKPKAKLAMIGNGLLEDEIKRKIKQLALENNIELLGYKTGEEKSEIFKQSKVVLHPAIYDSGGMAPCEAMAWGLPGVSFDLEALKTYYPKGMLKTPCYDLRKFAERIIELLENKELYQRVSAEAIDWAKEWAWDKRAEDVFKKIKVHLEEN